jgi:hypothetical protein
MAGLRDAGYRMLDAGLKTKHSRSFLPVFMSIQYLVPLGRDIQYPLLKLLQPRYYKNPGPDLACKDLIL